MSRVRFYPLKTANKGPSFFELYIFQAPVPRTLFILHCYQHFLVPQVEVNVKDDAIISSVPSFLGGYILRPMSGTFAKNSPCCRHFRSNFFSNPHLFIFCCEDWRASLLGVAVYRSNARELETPHQGIRPLGCRSQRRTGRGLLMTAIAATAAAAAPCCGLKDYPRGQDPGERQLEVREADRLLVASSQLQQEPAVEEQNMYPNRLSFCCC